MVSEDLFPEVMPGVEVRHRALLAARQAFANTIAATKHERISRWKARMRTSAEGAGKLAYQWLRGDAVAQCGLLRNDNGDLTGNADEVMGILHDKWMPTFQRYQVAPEPDADAFMLEYASEVDQLCLSAEPLRLPPLDANDLSQRLAKMPLEKATGLDSWPIKDL